jgi:hypothetical protein
VNEDDITNWEKKNTRAMQNIFGAIKEEQSRILMTCNSAREMWIKLESEYEKAAADSIPLLWTKFYGCTFRQGQSVSSFLTELEQIAIRLKSLHIAIGDEQRQKSSCHYLQNSVSLALLGKVHPSLRRL